MKKVRVSRFKKVGNKNLLLAVAVIAMGFYVQRNTSYTYKTPTGSTVTHTGANMKGIGWY
tara:strand:+ start:944 stop:1123 length:180 start_codon:yes stop_codon:yes gene_type:complete